MKSRPALDEVSSRGRDIYDLTMYNVRFCEEDYREDKESANEMMIDVLVGREVRGRWDGLDK